MCMGEKTEILTQSFIPWEEAYVIKYSHTQIYKIYINIYIKIYIKRYRYPCVSGY